jgi:hypothetical protein
LEARRTNCAPDRCWWSWWLLIGVLLVSR